ncbi:MAG: hypothetical protein ACRETF_08520 [Nevskiaceae bacterium]
MRRRSNRDFRWLGLVACLAVAPARADHHMGFSWSGDLGVGYDDNVGNAALEADVRDDTILSGALNLDFHWRPTLFTALLLRGSLRGEGYDKADGLSNGKFTAMARVSHRPGGGFYAPTLAGWISAAVWEFDSRMRDGSEYRAGVFLVGPITTAVSARLGVAGVERSGDSYVFDMSSWSAGIDIDWRVLPALTLYAGYQFHDGDIVSTGSVPPKSSHLPGGGGGSSAADPDDAFDGLFAYRVDATTHLVTVGVNVPLSARLAIDGQLRRADSETDGGTGYDRWQGTVSALVRF